MNSSLPCFLRSRGCLRTIHITHTAHIPTAVTYTHPNDRCCHALVRRFEAIHISAVRRFHTKRNNSKRGDRSITGDLILIFCFGVPRRASTSCNRRLGSCRMYTQKAALRKVRSVLDLQSSLGCGGLIPLLTYTRSRDCGPCPSSGLTLQRGGSGSAMAQQLRAPTTARAPPSFPRQWCPHGGEQCLMYRGTQQYLHPPSQKVPSLIPTVLVEATLPYRCSSPQRKVDDCGHTGSREVALRVGTLAPAGHPRRAMFSQWPRPRWRSASSEQNVPPPPTPPHRLFFRYEATRYNFDQFCLHRRHSLSTVVLESKLMRSSTSVSVGVVLLAASAGAFVQGARKSTARRFIMLHTRIYLTAYSCVHKRFD